MSTDKEAALNEALTATFAAIVEHQGLDVAETVFESAKQCLLSGPSKYICADQDEVLSSVQALESTLKSVIEKHGIDH